MNEELEQIRKNITTELVKLDGTRYDYRHELTGEEWEDLDKAGDKISAAIGAIMRVLNNRKEN